MADLDNFFAKKDKKRSKGTKFLNADELAKKLEKNEKRPDKMKKERSQAIIGQDEGDTTNDNQEEDEWRDFEEQKKDYSGLKIQNLIIDEDEEAGNYGEGIMNDEEDSMEENESGEMVPRKKSLGPWKCVTQPQPEESKAKPEKTKEISQGSYLPPHLRRVSQKQHPPKPSIPRMLKSNAAPNVNYEELFPTLSAAKFVETGKKKREDAIGFEDIRNSKSHSLRLSERTNSVDDSGKLSLDNKYGALTNDRS